MVYTGSYDCYENQNIHNRNDYKFNYVFVNCCSLVIVLSTEGYQITFYFSRVNRLISCYLYLGCISEKPAGNEVR